MLTLKLNTKDSATTRAGLLVAFVALAGAGIAQTQQQPQSPSQPPVTTSPATSTLVTIADGSVDPSKIPDDIAFMHFFRVLAEDPRATSKQVDDARRRSYVKYFFTKSCGAAGQEDRSLTETETTALLEYANQVTISLPAMQASPSGDSQVTSSGWPISSSISTAVLRAAGNLESALGAEVARKVRAHVADHMKPAIKIVQAQISVN